MLITRLCLTLLLCFFVLVHFFKVAYGMRGTKLRNFLKSSSSNKSGIRLVPNVSLSLKSLWLMIVCCQQACQWGPSDTSVEAACWQQWQWSRLATLSGHPSPTLRLCALQPLALLQTGTSYFTTNNHSTRRRQINL